MKHHRLWTGDHYPATCVYPGSNPGHSSDKRVFYHYAIQTPYTPFYNLVFFCIQVGDKTSLLERLRTHIKFSQITSFYLNNHKFSIKSYVLDVY